MLLRTSKGLLDGGCYNHDTVHTCLCGTGDILIVAPAGPGRPDREGEASFIDDDVRAVDLDLEGTPGFRIFPETASE